MYNLEQGTRMVRAARMAITQRVLRGQKGDSDPIKGIRELTEQRGVFVTLDSYPSGDLRGCIGFPEPIAPLNKLLISAAVYAAVEDPRFGPVVAEELDKITVCINLLSELEQITAGPDEIPKHIKIGKHGLVIRNGGSSGLLLPSVAVDEKWDALEFLDGVCYKAGLAEGAWKNGGSVLYRFSTQAFGEKTPNGAVSEL